MQLKSFIILTISPKPKAAAANFLRVCKVVTAPLCSNAAAARKATAEQAVPHPDTPTRVWELSERERQIIAELNHKDNESPCAAP